jgi:aminodeoxychorismate synthase component I
MVSIDLGTCAGADAASAFRALCEEPGVFWLDGGDREPAVLGCMPTRRLSIGGDGCVKAADPAGETPIAGDPLAAIEAFVRDATRGAGAVVPLVVGFLAYDLAPRVEAAMARGALPREPSPTPLAWLASYDAVAVCHPDAGGGVRIEVQATDRAPGQRLADLLVPSLARAPVAPVAVTARLVEAPDRADYVAAIARAKEYIAAGDVYQVNLSRRFAIETDAPPPEVYLRMRAAQPVPRGCFLAGDGFAVLSNSPETFLRVRGTAIETEPIKGTRPRAADPAADAAARADLVADPKERAEHVMIVDLERNDLGRICATGSVSVPSLLRVESYATLHHLVSTVRGRLRDDAGLAEILRATFPGGSITGAPKIRAAQVIAELEPVARGLYTGAIAWFRGERDFDSSIAIRTAVARDGRLIYQVGAGIVADSDPEREYAECLLKAKPLLAAAGLDGSFPGAATGDPGRASTRPEAADHVRAAARASA